MRKTPLWWLPICPLPRSGAGKTTSQLPSLRARARGRQRRPESGAGQRTETGLTARDRVGGRRRPVVADRDGVPTLQRRVHRARPHLLAAARLDEDHAVVAVVLDERDRRRRRRQSMRTCSGRTSTSTAPSTGGVERHRADARVGRGASRPARQQVGLADEAGHPRRRRPPVELRRCADLLDDASLTTATTSPSTNASSWSWVTNRAVIAVSASSRWTSVRTFTRSVVSRLENGSSSSSTSGRGAQRPGQGDPLLLAARQRPGVAIGERGRGRPCPAPRPRGRCAARRG